MTISDRDQLLIMARSSMTLSSDRWRQAVLCAVHLAYSNAAGVVCGQLYTWPIVPLLVLCVVNCTLWPIVTLLVLCVVNCTLWPIVTLLVLCVVS